MAKPLIHAVLAAADIRLTARQAALGAGAVALSMLAVLAAQIFLSKDFITPAGAPVGGDFVAFWAAAKAMAAGNLAALYDPAYFQEWLLETGPPREAYGLTWQYPPTYFFTIAFLAAAPFGPGYALWTGGSFAIFAAAMRAAGVKGTALLIALAAPAVFQAAITGQNGFLTASLLAGAALLPDRRPVLAGLCAALLTMKPQIGLLIPIAYIAGGHWRAFMSAALGALALAGASIAVFGLAPWTAFAESITGASSAMGAGVMPLYKMPTIFAAFTLAGAPKEIAFLLHAAGAAAAVWATAAVWRRKESAALRAGILCAGAYFVSPYLFYYELVILAIPLTLLALEAREKGWRPHDQLLLIILFMTPMFLPGDPRQAGFNSGFAVTVLAFVFVLRRLRSARVATLTQPA